MKSLQNKIFVFFVLLLLLVQAIAFGTMYQSNKKKEALTIEDRLRYAQQLIDSELQRRRFYLHSFAETVALDAGLKAFFDEDRKSLAYALNNHRKRIDADLAMVVGQDGNIDIQIMLKPTASGELRAGKGPEQDTQFRFLEQLHQGALTRFYAVNGELYQFSASPVKSGHETMGWVGLGFRIDERLADALQNSTGLHAVFVTEKGDEISLLGSSQNEPDLNLVHGVLQGREFDDVIAFSMQIDEGAHGADSVVIYAPREDIVAVLRDSWIQLLLLIAFSMLLSLGGAYLIAAGITKPIKLLVEQAKKLASGDGIRTVQINERNELGQLANEFNLMQEAVMARERTITHRAYHDPLTDLPNRNMLKLSLKHLGEQSGKQFCLMHLNICRLKDVNDTLGHDAGDHLIVEIASRLKQLKLFSLICHLGGDEFVMVCDKTARDDVGEKFAKLQQALKPDCLYQGINLQLQVRAGVAFYPHHDGDVMAILQKADSALHQARQQRVDYVIYDPEKDTNTVERLNLINDLKRAVEQDQLTLFYQPKLNLAQGKVTHVEALVRWQHPTLGMVPPDKFIHIAEQTGQINALTRWVFNEAMSQHLAWKLAGFDINMAINISAENLKDNGFYDFVCGRLMEKHIAPNRFTLEVTESAVVDDPEAAIALLSRFKAHGLHLSIDDYGTGYSSLAQLKHLPVHELKIDKSFVQNLVTNEDDKIIVKSTIEMAKNMGLSIVAEGVEDAASMAWLAQHGCTLAQGYYINRPLPAPELSQWLLEHDENSGQLRG